MSIAAPNQLTIDKTLNDPPPDGTTISARVTPALRDEIDRSRQGTETQSDTIRRLLRLALDTERQSNATMTSGGVARNTDPLTAKRAAWEVTPRAGSQRAKALAEFAVARSLGLTADDVCRLMPGTPLNSLSRRVTDLLQGGLIEHATYHRRYPDDIVIAGTYGPRPPASDEAPADPQAPISHLTRKTRNGSPANVYVITPAGTNVHHTLTP